MGKSPSATPTLSTVVPLRHILSRPSRPRPSKRLPAILKIFLSQGIFQGVNILFDGAEMRMLSEILDDVSFNHVPSAIMQVARRHGVERTINACFGVGDDCWIREVVQPKWRQLCDCSDDKLDGIRILLLCKRSTITTNFPVLINQSGQKDLHLQSNHRYN